MRENLVVTFNVADLNDLDVIVEMRIAYISEYLHDNNVSSIDRLRKSTADYFQAHLSDKSYIPFIGYIADKAVCCAGLLLDDPDTLSRDVKFRQGHIINLYVIPELRGKGVGYLLTDFISSYAAENGVEKLIFLGKVD